MASTIPPQYRTQYQQQQQQQQHQRAQQASHKRVQQSQGQGHQRPDDRAKPQERIEAERVQREKIRALTPTDKTMPEGVEDLIIGDGVEQYRKLRQMEGKLDAVMMRKRLDLMDPIQNAIKRYSTLRIWITNTVENQPWQGRDLDEDAFDFNTGVEATYKVKIEGRVLDDAVDEAAVDKDDNEQAGGDPMDTDASKGDTENPEQSPAKRLKLSHFFKQITIDFDRNKNLQPDGMTQVEWKKPLPPQPPPGFDCLEFERKSDENINIAVNLFRDEKQERFKLSKELSELLDTDELEKSNVIEGVQNYVRAMNLQRDEERRIVNCDERMKAVFHIDQLRESDLSQLLNPHLSSLPPLVLHYTIRCDPEYNAAPIPTIYTLHLQAPPTPGLPHLGAHSPFPPVNPPPPYVSQILATLSNNETLSTLKQNDKHTALLIQSINQSKMKHAFMTGMAKDPVGFTKRWMSSQRRDLEMVLGDGNRYDGGGGGGGEWASGKQWKGREMEEAIAVMVRKDGSARFKHTQ